MSTQPTPVDPHSCITVQPSAASKAEASDWCMRMPSTLGAI
jgi:hypothetical protein